MERRSRRQCLRDSVVLGGLALLSGCGSLPPGVQKSPRSPRVGIPFLGFVIPNLTGFFGTLGPRSPVYWVGCLWGLAISALLWQGKHRRVRRSGSGRRGGAALQQKPQAGQAGRGDQDVEEEHHRERRLRADAKEPV